MACFPFIKVTRRDPHDAKQAGDRRKRRRRRVYSQAALIQVPCGRSAQNVFTGSENSRAFRIPRDVPFNRVRRGTTWKFPLRQVS